MDRQQKINRLKAIMEGKVQPLQDQILFWQQLDNGLYQCETHGYTHFILTKENMNKFQGRFGGQHIVFECYSDDRDEPIKEERGSNMTMYDSNVLVWKEGRTGDKLKEAEENVSHAIGRITESVKPSVIEEIKPIQPVKEPKPVTKPSKKERRKKAKEQPVVIDRKAKEREAYERMLREQEIEDEKWARLKQLNQANQQLNNEISQLF